MKKYIFTENQIKKIIKHQVNEQPTAEDKLAKQQQSGFDAVYNNPQILQQMKKYPAGTKFGFSPKMAAQISKNSHSNILYQVKKGDTVGGIVRNMGGNSEDNVYYDNDLISKRDPNSLKAGMVITFSLLPSGR